jgi:hypothetical protein
MQPRPPVRAITTSPVPLAAIPVPIVALPNAWNERIVSVRPVALTVMDPPIVIFCPAYSTALSIATATQRNAKTPSADTTPEISHKYDKHVKKTEAFVQICLTHGVPKDQIDDLVDLALAPEFDDDDLPYPGDVFDDHAHQSAIINCMTTTWAPRHTTADLQDVIHPALFPSLASVLHSQSSIPPLLAPCLLPSATVTINLLRFDPSKAKLADGGANCSASGDRSILHDYHPGSRYNIKGVHGESKPATGEGYIHLVNNFGGIERVLALYSAYINDTVISPEHHASTNPNIHSWV